MAVRAAARVAGERRLGSGKGGRAGKRGGATALARQGSCSPQASQARPAACARTRATEGLRASVAGDTYASVRCSPVICVIRTQTATWHTGATRKKGGAAAYAASSVLDRRVAWLRVTTWTQSTLVRERRDNDHFTGRPHRGRPAGRHRSMGHQQGAPGAPGAR